MEKKNLELVEFIFDPESTTSGLFAMSIVDRPAINKNAQFFSEQASHKFTEVKGEKGLFVGPAMVPNVPIYRNETDSEGEVVREYYGYFSAETVEKLAHLYMRRGRQNIVTVMHAAMVEGCSIVEAWMVADPERDKAAVYGQEVPAGTWMIAMQVDNPEVRTQIKEGKLKGFSIEAMLEEVTKRKDQREQKQPTAEEQFAAQFKAAFIKNYKQCDTVTVTGEA